MPASPLPEEDGQGGIDPGADLGDRRAVMPLYKGDGPQHGLATAAGHTHQQQQPQQQVRVINAPQHPQGAPMTLAPQSVVWATGGLVDDRYTIAGPQDVPGHAYVMQPQVQGSGHAALAGDYRTDGAMDAMQMGLASLAIGPDGSAYAIVDPSQCTGVQGGGGY